MKYFARISSIIFIIFLLQACSASRKNKSPVHSDVITNNRLSAKTQGSGKQKVLINTKGVDPASVVDFAETLTGTKYKYGSSVKEQGFDCSGFITYVFNHFHIQVPRVSKDFTNAGTMISPADSRKGDLILFTGKDTTGWIVGHMGMITDNENGNIRFIHSSSGKSIGVINSGMSQYYATRFVKVIRIFY